MKNNKCIWFTGYSGAGKTTLSKEIHKILQEKSIPSIILDGDELRLTLNNNLGFSKEDRIENIRRVSHVAKMFHEQGYVVICSTISPYKECRDNARNLFNKGDFLEIFLNTSLDTCKKRDVKGLYKKVEDGVIKNFTGVSDDYERPESPEILINTEVMSIEESVDLIMQHIRL